MDIFSRRSGPDFIIVGAQKAGTTALHQMLQQHPQIRSAAAKEVHYFDNDIWYGKGRISEYHQHFPRLAKQQKRILTFEASPLYLYHPLAAGRLHRYNSKLKLIALLREPAARAFSAWTMYHHHFKTGPNQALHDPRTFDEAIAEDLSNLHASDYTTDIRAYVKRGFYAAQLDRYFQYFQKEQVMVLENKDISDRWASTSQKLRSFLDIAENTISVEKALERQVNQAEMYRATIDALRHFYAPHNKTLADMLDRDFGWNEK